MDKKERKSQTKEAKKSLIRTKTQSSRFKILVTTGILLVIALVYYLIDSGSYVASVDGHRISRSDYQFFLSQQQSATEEKEGISSKTAAEKKAFWLKAADGQNTWETAKSSALDYAKEYMIQLIKAKEMKLTVNADIKSEVSSFMEQSKGSLTDKEFAKHIQDNFKITPKQLVSVSENLSLIDKFKAAYLTKNYKAAEISDADIKATYDKSPKQFDTADIRYIHLSLLNEQGAKLSDDQIAAKKKKAEEALNKLKSGEDIEKVIETYTEEQKDTSSTSAAPLGSASIGYYEGNKISEWVYANKPEDVGMIEVDSDIYVVKIVSRTTFNDVKASVKSTMENEAKEKFYDDALNSWKMDTRFNIIKNNRVYDSFIYK